MTLPFLAQLLTHSAAFGRHKRDHETHFLGFRRPQIFVAAHYDIITAGENWVAVVASGVAAGLAGSRRRACLVKARPR
jgi:hypothetical protein